MSKHKTAYYAHESAVIDEPVTIGAGTEIRHFAHICSGARIGERCVLGQNTMIDRDVRIGSNVTIQNNVAIYTGTQIEDDVFLGPNCVLTNISNPRSEVRRSGLYERILIRRGATVGANATILCGVTLGRYAFIAAGAVVTASVPDYGLIAGVPGRQIGWMSRHGHVLRDPDEAGVMLCPETGYRYKHVGLDVLRCLDLDEDDPLPPEMSEGKISYDKIKDRYRT